VHRAGDGGAVHPVQHGQGLVGQLAAQDHQGGQDPVAEGQAVVGSGAGGALAWVAAALLQGAFVGGAPRSASSTVSAARCCREIPVKTGWERAARAHAG
jgi:hypothetical protein